MKPHIMIMIIMFWLLEAQPLPLLEIHRELRIWSGGQRSYTQIEELMTIHINVRLYPKDTEREGKELLGRKFSLCVSRADYK